MMNKRKLIRGAGSGGREPKITPDNLHSRQFATLQDLISEGEIEGFATPSRDGITDRTSIAYNNAALKDVFLDDTPILNATASNTNPSNTDFNFPKDDITFKTRFGEATQTRLTGIPLDIRSPEVASPNTFVTKLDANNQPSNGVVKQITQACDAVIVTLTWPVLQEVTKKGDINGLSVEYTISTKASNQQNADEKIRATVSGRSADAFSRDHRIPLSGSFPIDVIVKRITDDQEVGGLKTDRFKFVYIQRVFDRVETYNNSAYTGLRLDSALFSAIPKRVFRVRGIKVRIPGAGANNSGTPQVVKNQADANALNLGTVSSFGFIHYPNGYIFNGTMQAATWTTCPAMILLDLLTNKRYGLGDHIAPDQTNDSTLFSNIDLFTFYSASKFANFLVDDGSNTGAKEARFSCNVNIQNPKEAFTAINELASCMRAMPIWSAGSISLAQDEQKTASYLFNLANVGEKGFVYQGSSAKQRNPIISVSYFNMDSQEIDFEIVGNDIIGANAKQADIDRQNKFGTSIKQVKAFACTSRNQAVRLARAIQFAEEFESETVTFTTSIDSGLLVRPGAVIEINDPVRAGARTGGRIVAATTTSITIDSPSNTTLPSLNQSPKISVILPDGTVEERSISNINGAVLTLSTSLSQVPNVSSPYLLSSTELQSQLFRVIQVEEEDEVNYSITALTYVDGKYNYIENNEALPVRNISILDQSLNSPSNLQAEETLIVINGIARSKLIVSWKEPSKQLVADDGNYYDIPQGPAGYKVNYRIRRDAGGVDNFKSIDVVSNDFELLDTEKGSIDFEIYSISATNKLSANALEGNIPTEGKTGRPDDVLNLAIEAIDEKLARITFTQSSAVDVLYGGSVFIRHTAETGNAATFASGQNIVDAAPGNTTEVIVPALPGTYLVKFQDDTGQFSATAARVELELVDIFDSILLKNDREHNDNPPFNFNNNNLNLFSNTQYSSNKGGLIITNPSLVINGTYTQSGITITCNINSHGLVVGQTKDFDFFTGDAKSGKYTIKSVSGNSFTVESTVSASTVGSVRVLKGLNGTYDFKDFLDLGSVFSLNLRRQLRGAGFFPSSLWDDRVGLVDSFPDWDGDLAENAISKIFVSTTNDDPNSSSATFTKFTEFSNGTFKGRGFKFQALLETTDSAQNVVVQELGYLAEMPVRTEQSTLLYSSNVASPSGSGIAKQVTFTKPFFTGTSSTESVPKPSVSISPQNSQAGDHFTITNLSGTSFTVTFFNSGSIVNRSFTYNAVGFGKGV